VDSALVAVQAEAVPEHEPAEWDWAGWEAAGSQFEDEEKALEIDWSHEVRVAVIALQYDSVWCGVAVAIVAAVDEAKQRVPHYSHFGEEASHAEMDYVEMRGRYWLAFLPLDSHLMTVLSE